MSSAESFTYKIEAVSTQGTVIFCKDFSEGTRIGSEVFVRDSRSGFSRVMNNDEYGDYLYELSSSASEKLGMVESTFAKVLEQQYVIDEKQIRKATQSLTSSESWIESSVFGSQVFSSEAELFSFVRGKFGIQMADVPSAFQPSSVSRQVA